jgi:hypothetical protein
MTNTQHREQATTKYDLPHKFEGASTLAACVCGLRHGDTIHDVEAACHPETAQHGNVLVTEKGI